MACTYPSTASSVDDWLDAINMGRYKTALSSAGIQVDALRELSDEKLQAAGVSMVGHRKRLLQAAKQLEVSSQPEGVTVQAPELVPVFGGARAGMDSNQSMDVDMSQAPYVFGASAANGSLPGADGGIGANSSRGSNGGGSAGSSTGQVPGGALGSGGATTAVGTMFDAMDTSGGASTREPKPHQRPNSTSSIYITSTLVKPDTDEVVFCISAVIHDRILQGEAEASEVRHRFPFFSEDNNPLYAPPSERTAEGRESGSGSDSSSTTKRTRREAPTEDMIFHTIRSVFTCARIPSECLVVSLVYIERLVAVSGCPVLVTTWRPIFLSALILAQKVWDDRSLHNIDFSVFCPMFTLKEINFLEKKFLELIDYDVSISASLYASYYFQLRTLCQRVDKEFTLKPMDAATAATLEARGVAYKDKFSQEAGGSTRKHQSDNIIHGGAPGSVQSSAFLQKLFGN